MLFFVKGKTFNNQSKARCHKNTKLADFCRKCNYLYSFLLQKLVFVVLSLHLLHNECLCKTMRHFFSFIIKKDGTIQHLEVTVFPWRKTCQIRNARQRLLTKRSFKQCNLIKILDFSKYSPKNFNLSDFFYHQHIWCKYISKFCFFKPNKPKLVYLGEFLI